MSPKLQIGTVLIHGDGAVHPIGGTEVAPSIPVSTSQASFPEEGLDNVDVKIPERHALIFFKPKHIAINGGYFGCHDTIDPGDLCWLETPLNPTGREEGSSQSRGKLLVHSTFAPPPLQYPFKWDADWYLIATKYFGGHSDLLGVLVVKTLDEWTTLQHDRTYLGNVLGSLESETATVEEKWLQSAERTPASQTFDGVPGRLTEGERGFQPKHQLEGGWNGTFAIQSTTPEQAIQLPHTVKNFVAATSLGGVESLIEYKARADVEEDPRLIRISDLKDDLRIGLQKIFRKLPRRMRLRR
ncbi:hypothetical protein IW262DRAFT_1445142 [Armillaria fumosa]|nr:hypothetical protein IW262DRAFT_1445142 [Armillaria fumosa]